MTELALWLSLRYALSQTHSHTHTGSLAHLTVSDLCNYMKLTPFWKYVFVWARVWYPSALEDVSTCCYFSAWYRLNHDRDRWANESECLKWRLLQLVCNFMSIYSLVWYNRRITDSGVITVAFFLQFTNNKALLLLNRIDFYFLLRW